MKSEQEIFEFAVADALEMLELKPSEVISFEHFQTGRKLTHAENVNQRFELVLESSKITGPCMAYPGDQFLGYKPETGEAWFEDYAGTICGPLKAVEKRLYLWALVEDTEALKIETAA